MTVLWTTKGAGSAIASELQLKEREYKMLFAGGWSSIERAGLHEAGMWFVRARLPKRFTEEAHEMGYNPSGGNRGGLNSGGGWLPLVQHGRLRAFLLSKAYAEARATKTNASITIRMPVPTMLNRTRKGVFDTGMLYTANRLVNKVLHFIGASELEQMAEIVATTMNSLINEAAVKTNKSGAITGYALTDHQRQSIAHTVKPQGSIHGAVHHSPSIAA